MGFFPCGDLVNPQSEKCAPFNTKGALLHFYLSPKGETHKTCLKNGGPSVGASRLFFNSLLAPPGQLLKQGDTASLDLDVALVGQVFEYAAHHLA